MIKKIIIKLKKEVNSEFAKNILTVFSGLSISQIIPIIVSPILTRIYSPEEFGILALFISTGMIFGNIATFQYDAAIMLPKEDKDAINILALSIGLTILITVFSTFIVFLFNMQLIRLMDNEKVAFWLYFVPVSVLLTGVFRSFSVWVSRKKQFKIIAERNITQTASTAGGKLLLGYANYTNSGLIIGYLFGQFVSTFMLVYESFKRSVIKTQMISWKVIKQNAKKYKEFPLFTNWQGFFDMINDTGSRYIISNIWGATILGWYSFTFGMLQRPLQIIGQSVSQVYYQKGAEIYNNNGDLWRVTKKIILRLSLIGIIVFFPILIFGKTIFVFVFGSKWAEAGGFAQVLVPWLFAKFILSPISHIPIIVNKQKQFFFITSIINLIIPINFYLFEFWIHNFEYILFTNSIFILLSYCSILIWFRKITIQINIDRNY